MRSVILGTAHDNGPIPTVEEAYDPKSLEHILAGTYPAESDMIYEMTAFQHVLERYGVTVHRPKVIPDLNQIFTRDIGFVIENKFIKANILPERADEWQAIKFLVDKIDPNDIIEAPSNVHIEGGDVILWNDYIFVGTYTGSDYTEINTARTNIDGVNFLKNTFPTKKDSRL